MATIQIRSGLIHGFTLSTTTHSNNQPPDPSSIGYEVCGYAAKDHSKINEGEGKENYGSIVKRSKTSAFHVDDTGSNPVGATIGV